MSFRLAVATLAANMPEDQIARIARVSRGKTPFDDSGDWKLTLKNCYNAKHLSVFEFANITYWIECPIFVARQLMRYRNARYLERSLRYCAPLNEVDVNTPFGAANKRALDLYGKLIDCGISKEEARAVLPLSTATRFVMQCDLRELFHIFDERIHPATQTETQIVVEKMKIEAEKAFPYCVSLYDAKRDER